jgi:prepilin signal peptidase PulO-like enzyme (type II secretory pathway)
VTGLRESEPIITDNPHLVAMADTVRVFMAALATMVIVMYVRLAWLRWRRHEWQWPLPGTVALCLLLATVAWISLERRGLPVTWRAPLAWAGIVAAAVQAFRTMRIPGAPPWARHPRKGRHRP